MIKLYPIVFFCWLLIDLTVSNETKTINNKNHKPTEPTAAISAEHLLKDVVPIIMEGQPPTTEVKHQSLKTSSLQEVTKKGSRTVPRKGVLEMSEKIYKNGTMIQDKHSEKLPVVKTSTSNNLVLSKEVTTEKTFSKISMTTEKQKTFNATLEKEKPMMQGILSSSTTKKKPKHKPIVTVGGKEPDGPIPASPTSKSPLSMPRKIDYIIPVIITVTALPLFGIAFYVLYKRGKDYWSKRHYRRMDFLIDGMYNE